MSALSTVLRGSHPAPLEPDSNESRTLAAIAGFHKEHRYGPSTMDLQLRTGLTVTSVRTSLKNLHALGLVLWDEGVLRSLRVATPEERHEARREAWADVLAKLTRDELRALRDALSPLLSPSLPEPSAPEPSP